MIWLLRPDHPEPNGVRPRHGARYGSVPRLPVVAGKTVEVAFDGGRMTSDAGVVLLAAVERRLGLRGGRPPASRTSGRRRER
jgi:hypothetical protein